MGKKNTLHSVHVQRNDTAENWTRVNPILQKGEMGVESDTRKFKFGDGEKHWQELDYADKTLDDAIKAEASRATGRENAIEAAYKAADKGIDDALQAEIARATGEEAAIRGEFAAADTAETTRAKAREDEIEAAYKAADIKITTAYKAADEQTLTAAKQHAETKIAELVGSAPATLDTLEEIAAALGKNENSVTTILEQVGKKADKTYVDTELAKKADASHTHSEYATKTEITSGTLKAGKAVTADTATTATKLGSATVGGTDTPVYINAGVPTAVNKVKAAAKADQLYSESVPENADLNTYTTPGKMYNCAFNKTAQTLQNRPTDQSFSLFVSDVGSNSVIQTLTTYKVDNSRKIYQRSYYSYTKTWSEWVRIYTTIDKPTAADVGALTQAAADGRYAAKATTLSGYGITDAVKNTMTVKATKLDAGQEPTIEYNKTGNILTVGIPKGDTGATGAAGAAGAKGDTGAAAGFGAPTATVVSGIGTPGVTVTATGPDTAKVFKFAFTNLKGEKGAAGAQGATPTISATASVDSTSGTPSVKVTKSGDSLTPVFNFAFSGLKGEEPSTDLLEIAFQDLEARVNQLEAKIGDIESALDAINGELNEGAITGREEGELSKG